MLSGAKHLCSSFPHLSGQPFMRTGEILRRPSADGLLSRNSMNYSFQLSNLGRADRKVSYLLFCAPRTSSALSTLDPRRGSIEYPGATPPETRPQQGPTLKGSNPVGVTPLLPPAAQGNTTPPGSGNERGAFRGRCPRLLSCALAGHEKTTLRSYPAAPVSDVTDSHFRLCMLRMTDDFNLRMQDKLAHARRRSNFRFPQTSYS